MKVGFRQRPTFFVSYLCLSQSCSLCSKQKSINVQLSVLMRPRVCDGISYVEMDPKKGEQLLRAPESNWYLLSRSIYGHISLEIKKIFFFLFSWLSQGKSYPNVSALHQLSHQVHKFTSGASATYLKKWQVSLRPEQKHQKETRRAF